MFGISDDLREEVKKRVYLTSNVDEFNCSSGPLTDFVVKHYLAVAPSKKSQLKAGYAAHITKEGNISPCAIMLGLLYIQRLSATNPGFARSLSSKELFLASMIAASKYLNDEGEHEALVNSDWAEIGKVPKGRVDDLEREFLEAIEWRLYVSLEEFSRFVSGVEGRLALAQAQIRGWLSYSDLVSIWEWVDVNQTMAQAASHTARTIATSTAMYLMYLTAVFATSSSLTQPAAVNELTVPSADFSPADFIVYHSSHLHDVAPLAYNPALPHTYRHTHSHLHGNFHQDWGPGGGDDNVVTEQQCPWQRLMEDGTGPQILHKSNHLIIKVNQNSHSQRIHNPHLLNVRTEERNRTVVGGPRGRCLPLSSHLFTHSKWTSITPGTAVC